MADIYRSRIAGVDNEYVMTDANGAEYRIGPNGDTSQVRVQRNGSVAALVGGFYPVAKSASYTVTNSDHGTLFHTTGASAAVTFTLPTPGDSNAGMNVVFFNTVGQTMTVTCATADKIVAFNNASADSVGYATASELIGSGFLMVSTGTVWLCLPLLGSDSATITVTDS